MFVVEDEHIVYANPRAAEIFGRPREQLLGMKLDQVVHPDDRRDGNQRLRERAEGRTLSAPYTIRGLLPDGSIRELETQSALRTIDGRHVVVISILDFTERNRTQRVLNQMAEAVGAKVGQEFFSSLVLNLSRTLGVDYAFVAEIADHDRLHMIALAVDGKIAEPITYEMVNTPCERVIGSSLCWFDGGIQGLFPRDHLLAAMGAEAYAGVPLFDANGQAIGLVAILHRHELPRERSGEAALEIYAARAGAELERRRAERALLASKTYVDSLLESSAAMIMELDAAGTVVRVNHTVEEVTGLRRDELLGRAASALFPGISLSEETAIHRRGEERLIAWRNREIRDPSGHVAGMFIVGADVTEQRRLQRDVQRSAAEWKQTFDHVNTPILVTDGDGVVVRVNRAACALVEWSGGPQSAGGQKPADPLGRRVGDLDRGEPWQTAMQLILHAASTGGTGSAEARDRHERTWDLTVAHFVAAADDAPRFILVMWDISGVVELQESLSRTATMSVMGNLVAGVAHEVRNPLFGISATLDAYAEELDRPGYHECAEALRTEVARLKRLMQELLEYGKPATLQIDRAQIGDVIDEAVAGFAYRERGVRVARKPNHGLPALLMDRARMRQVFENLIDNAAQVSSPESDIGVATQVIEMGGRKWVECRVEDRGPGFSAEDLERAFEPFFSRRKGGTGLGLPIVQRIVEEHSGKVFAANRPDGGAVITVRLPVAEL